MTQDLARTAYQGMEASTASGLQLVVMLYEGAIRFLNDAAAGIRDRDVRAKNQAVDRALAIVGELQATLRMEEGGEIAHQLDRLYAYMTARILDGSLRLDAAPLLEVAKLMTSLNGAWQQIATQTAAQTAASPLPMPEVLAGQPVKQASLELFG